MRYKVGKSTSRSYDYSLQDTTGKRKDWLGPNCTACWYKLKYKAQERANELNLSEKG